MGFLVFILLVALSGCDIDKSSESIPSILSPSSTTGIGSGTAQNTVISTSTGGYIVLNDISSLQLSSSQTFMSATGDGAGNVYIFDRNGTGSTSDRYEFLQIGIGQSNPTTACSVLYDSNFSTGVAVDASYFYVVSNNSKIRRFSRSGCSESTALSLPSNVTESNSNSASLSVDGNLFYYDGQANFVFNSGNGLATSTFTSAQTVGTQSVGGSAATAPATTATYSGTRWGILHGYLWKLASPDKAVGWAQLPTSVNVDYPQIVQLAITAIGTLQLLVGSGSAISVYQFDVSHF